MLNSNNYWGPNKKNPYNKLVNPVLNSTSGLELNRVKFKILSFFYFEQF